MSVPQLALPWLLVLTAAGLGCATGGGGSGGGRVQGGGFPSAREVERLENAAPPDRVMDENLRRVKRWKIEAPVPKRIDARPWVQRDPWGTLLGGAVEAGAGNAVPTQAMHCIASELARFALVEGGRPDSLAFRFLVGGCNASITNVAFASLQGEVGGSEGEDEVFARWRDDTSAMIDRVVASGDRLVLGVAFARHEGRGAIVVTYGRPLLELEATETSLARGEPFELRGRVRGVAQYVHVMMNRGRYEVETCQPVGEVALPAFHFRCTPSPSDESTWVSLAYGKPNRFLATQALDALVWPGGSRERVFQRNEYTDPRPITDVALFVPAVREDLNAVRARAGAPPVEIDVAQSATSSRVAPHLFAALVGEQGEEAADLAALGLLAGWDVEGMIRTGGLAFAAVPETDDLALLLATALEEPMSRETLLDPAFSRLAVGSLVGEVEGTPFLAAVFTGYDLFEETTKDSDADELFARLTQARHGRERSPPYRLVQVWMDAMQSAERVAGGDDPQYAMDDLLQQSAEALRREVSGWYSETSDLADFEFPRGLIDAPRLGAAIGISHVKGPDDAWGRYAVMIISVAH